MAELYFRLGETKGFTAIDLADKKEGYATPIRELLQNSLDASREAGNHECEINIYIETIPKSKIPYIEEYEKVLNAAVDTHKKLGSFNRNSQRVLESIKADLKKKNISVLMFSDNGSGMPQKRMDAILNSTSIKGNQKADSQAGGSFGVGHLSSYWLSSLRYVLYATKYKGEDGTIKSLFTGSPILAGHIDNKNAQRGPRGRIVEAKPKDERGPAFDYPKEFPDFVETKMNTLGTGTIVAILGLSEAWDIEAEYAIASNFFHAISHEALKIRIHNEKQEMKLIDTDEMERLIANRKEGKKKAGENVLSGKATHQAWQAIKEQDKQKNIALKNDDKVYVFLKTDRGSASTVVLIRNGMLIARHDSMLSLAMEKLRKNPDFEPFTAVIDVDQTDAPKLFDLVKGAESAYHNKLEKNRLSPSEEKELKNLLKELSEKIEKHLTKIDRESFLLPLFPLPNKASAKASGVGETKGQSGKAKPEISTPRPPKPKPPTPTTTPTPPRPKPIDINRNLNARNAVRYKDQGTNWEVKLRVTPNAVDAGDDVYLSMCLGEDNDTGKTKTYLDFTSIAINGRSITVEENKNQILLGQLEKEKPYEVIAEIEKPENIGNMRVALLPILGLKKRKAEPKKAKTKEK